MTLTQAEAERRYDAERNGTLYITAGPLGPAVLDVATVRVQALAEWDGKIQYTNKGELRRDPALPETKIGHLEDGAPVYGHFDDDDVPLTVWVDYEGFSIRADETAIYLRDAETGKEYYEITLEQFERLKHLVNSGAVEQALYFGRTWSAQRQAA